MESSNFASFDAEVANDISGTESEPRLVRLFAYNMFIEASFKLGRITDCDPNVGKNFFRACEKFTETGLPIFFPFVQCEFV